MDTLHNPKCFMNHMGVWAVEPLAAQSIMSAIRNGVMSADSANLDSSIQTQDFQGIRVIPMSGLMQKGRSKYGGVSTIDMRREIAAANRDDSINGIMLLVDSPGGHSSGTQALADEIAGSAKPVRAHVDDLAASAALWAVSQASFVTADKTSSVGSIGSFTVLADTTGAQEMAGIKLHLVSTGPLKGAGGDGEVTEELLAAVQKRVDDVNEFFLESLANGRGISRDDLSQIATGDVFNAQEALSHNLIDQVSDFETALIGFVQDTSTQSRSNAARARVSIAKRR